MVAIPFRTPHSEFRTPTMPARILSGIKPTGNPHIGNYFGMMRPAIEWQEKGEAFYFIADYHALTTVFKPAALREYVRGVALDFLACGLDPAKAVLFRQSDVPEHTELAWLLSRRRRCRCWKIATPTSDHVARRRCRRRLFAYPVLMAATSSSTTRTCAVGRDQKQHVEVTRDWREDERALRKLFVVPEASILPSVQTIPGLDGLKMSKSYENTIELFEQEKALRKKVMGIVTDSTPVEAPKEPAGSAIVGLYRLFASDADVAQMEADFRAGGVGYGEFKKRLFGAIWEYFAPLRARRAEIEADPAFMDRVLAEGAEKARAVAQRTMSRVRAAVGLR